MYGLKQFFFPFVLLKKIVPLCLLFCLGVSLASQAQGDLLITPKRVVFDESKRSADISLANSGRDSATYAVSFIQIRMTENGSFEVIEAPDPGQQFADSFLRIFPRLVTLGPNEAQTVKVQFRRTDGVKEGEYRSHLYFRAVQKQVPLGQKGKADSSISVKLTPVFGISIPVIIRVGASDAKVEITDVAMKTDKDGNPVTSLSFERSGNMSVYGDIAVNHVSNNGKVTKVGMAKGFAVYTPNARRHFDLALDKTVRVDYQTGKLQVTYTDQMGKSVVLAQKEILLQKSETP